VFNYGQMFRYGGAKLADRGPNITGPFYLWGDTQPPRVGPNIIPHFLGGAAMSPSICVRARVRIFFGLRKWG